MRKEVIANPAIDLCVHLFVLSSQIPKLREEKNYA